MTPSNGLTRSLPLEYAFLERAVGPAHAFATGSERVKPYVKRKALVFNPVRKPAFAAVEPLTDLFEADIT